MPCFHPVPAWRYQPLARLASRDRPIPTQFPCGKCIGCQQSKQRAWALRITHEAQTNRPSCFITLTYDEPCYPSLNPSDFDHFLWRLRKAYGPTRYFMCGEYGALNMRPHFHAILFGRDFDRSYVVSGSDATAIYASPTLARLWPHGFSSVAGVSLRSARYVAKYTCKSVRKIPAAVCDPTTGEYVPLSPEYARMSRRPGLGAAWFAAYSSDVYAARDGVCLPGGVVVPAPRYYDKLLEDSDPSLRDSKRISRVVAAYNRRADATPQRLLSREICALASVKQRKGKL